VTTDGRAAAVRVLAELGLGEVTSRADGVTALLGDVPVGKIVPALVHAEVSVLGFRVERPSLEDLFVSLTGEGFDVNG
jgi:ABC-2 type transport system ATP-binding protein